ncbi:hypothetical protein [Microcoleus sp. S13_C5]|uniref:hypothetical protein n=1 Tax=Microcoleus sp. S13_C5 TaxID=3055411 RepID=UPI002FD4787E
MYNKLSHAKKNLSALEREIQILAQFNFCLFKKNAALVKSYNTLLEATTAKDQALKYCEEKISSLKDRYDALDTEKCTLEYEVTTLTEEKCMLGREIDRLTDTIFELRSLATPFSCDGTSAEDYLNPGW